MKTLKSVLITVTATAAFSLFAGEPLQSPKASGLGPQVIASTGVQDPNLVAGARLGKYTAETTVAVATDKKDANLVASISSCPMAPKTKGTPECEKHCATAKK